MHIGLDFDNTIVSYDTLFHKVALEQGLIDHTIPVNKLAVRDYLRNTDREPIWTEMQGYVYGARMTEAQAYPQVFEVMQRMKDKGHTLTIISHKTKHPYLGKKYDLHDAARQWIEKHLIIDGQRLIAQENIYFELTKNEKLERIKQLACDIFIDDLPEILLAENFPKNTKPYLFDPEQHHNTANFPHLTIVASWASFENSLL